jgi:rhodanese-related sulfurtransferase
MQHSQKFLDLVNDSKKRIKEMTIEELVKRQKAGEHLEFVDTREDNEWTAAHPKGARHMSRGIIERDIENTVPDTSTMIVLMCGGGFRSALSADSLQKMGYKNVWSLAGGWRAWKEAKLPEEKG